MPPTIDPYRDWLDIGDSQRPLDHYGLLGIRPLESDARVINAAAQAQLKKLTPLQSGENGALAGRVAAEIAVAHQTLSDPRRKAAYDTQLRDRPTEELAAAAPVDKPTASPAVATNQPVGPVIATSPLVTDLPGGRRRRRSPIGLIIGSVGFAMLAALFGVLWWARGDDALNGQNAGNPPAANSSGRRPAFAAVNDSPVPLPADDVLPDAPSAVETEIHDSGSSTQSPPDDPTTDNDPSTVETDRQIQDPVVNSDPPATAWSASPVGRSLSIARLMLARRELDVSGRTLDQAARLATRPEEFGRIARLRMLHRWVRDFWAAFDRNRGRTPAGFQFRVDDTLYTIDEFTAEDLKITFDGRQHEYTNGNVPAPVAATLGARKFHRDDPYGKLCVAAFWVIDRDGDPFKAAELFPQIRSSGLPIDALVAELPDSAGPVPNGTTLASPESAGTAQTEVESKLSESRGQANHESSAGLPAESDTLVIPLGPEVSMTLRRMPAGSYMQGVGNNQTYTEITEPFYIGVTEVTQAQWLAVAGANPSYYRDEPNLPVDSVSFNDCQKFIQLLNATPAGRKYRFRLPTEAEWEYAYRAGTTTTTFFGDDLGDFGSYGWSNANAGGRTHPVGQLQPNPAGLYDILGNVWEWTQEQVTRGGGIADTPKWGAVGSNKLSPDKSHRTWGLRLACDG